MTSLATQFQDYWFNITRCGFICVYICYDFHDLFILWACRLILSIIVIHIIMQHSHIIFLLLVSIQFFPVIHEVLFLFLSLYQYFSLGSLLETSIIVLSNLLHSHFIEFLDTFFHFLKPSFLIKFKIFTDKKYIYFNI